MDAKVFESTVIGGAGKALDRIRNVLESSTEYPVICKELDSARPGGNQNGGRNGR